MTRSVYLAFFIAASLLASIFIYAVVHNNEEVSPGKELKDSYRLNNEGITVFEFTPKGNEDYVCIYTRPNDGWGGTIHFLGCIPNGGASFGLPNF